MKEYFKVEIRKTCKICGKPITGRFRTFCSTSCRNKDLYRMHKDYTQEWQRQKRGEYAEGKKRCIICGNWYIQVGSHIFWTHHETARDYREEFDLPVKRGITPSWFRKLKGDQAIENQTYLNLRAGTKNRFVKGDERAKRTTFWKGHRYTPDEYYG